MKPTLLPFTLEGFHRLIPSRYSDGGSVLADLATTQRMLDDLVLLDGATNDRIQGEQQGLPGISTYELVYGIPNAHIVNAAFTHTNEAGSRFNDHARGAWYAAEELETSLAEVAYHKARRLADIVVPELPGEQPDEDASTFDDWLADFNSSFHVLEPAAAFPDCLVPEPVPQCYRASQQMAGDLIETKSNGIVYPSVRRANARCLVCFRPALVYNTRRGERLTITFRASGSGYSHHVHTQLPSKPLRSRIKGTRN